MTKLIDDLLTLARADAGSSELTLSQIDLCKPLREACREASVLAERKNIRFREDVPQVEASALGDADALRRLFLILLDNAVKYTSSEGSVEVGLAVRQTGSEVLIRDSGVGIAAEDLDHIFERFYRADKARQWLPCCAALPAISCKPRSPALFSIAYRAPATPPFSPAR